MAKIKALNETMIKNQLREGKLEKLYFIMGEDGLLKQKYCDKIKSMCVSSGMEAFDLCELDGKSLQIDTLNDELIRFPLMSPKRCVVLTNFEFSPLKQNERKDFFKAIENIPDTTCFIIYQSGIAVDEKDDKWKTFFSKYKDIFTFVNFGHRSPAEVRASIKEFCRRKGVNIDISVMNYMMEVSSADLNTMRHESEKLCRYLGEGATVTKADVDKICSRNKEASVFDLAKFIIAKDATKALEKLNTLLFNGESPVMLCSLMTNNFIDMYRVRVAIDSGLDPMKVYEQLGYTRYNTFRLTNVSKISARLSKKAQRTCIDLLCEADMKLKSTGYDSRAVLENVILRLISIVKGETY